jgi:RNA polymerase sigma factor (sigma-70 family)
MHQSASPIAREREPVDDPLGWFTDLYDQYYRNVLRYALVNAEPGAAEDVASEAFLIAWRQLPAVPEQPLPWLLAVARNLIRKQADAGRRRRQLAARIAELTTQADMIAWDAGEHVVERAAAIEALGSLGERDVEALTLVTWHGLDARAAAAVVGCSPRAFTVRLHRARQRLTDALSATDQMQRLHPAAGSARQPALPRSQAASTHGSRHEQDG